MLVCLPESDHDLKGLKEFRWNCAFHGLVWLIAHVVFKLWVLHLILLFIFHSVFEFLLHSPRSLQQTSFLI